MDYANDVRSAVEVLSKGMEFAEALRLVSAILFVKISAEVKTALHNRSELIESVIHPGLEDAQEELSEVFEEMRGQLDKEMNRIAELRKVLEDDPGKSSSTPLKSCS
jgi:elongator complex protein 1